MDTERRAVLAFWLLGCLNNSSFVIMIAAATSIESGGVGIVYLADIMPGLVLKASAPYWFDRVSYRTRTVACAFLMSMCFLIVALAEATALQLLGVALASAQCSVGEASMLALASRYKTAAPAGARRADDGEEQAAAGAGAATLTAWSSGTGFAGVFGYAWLTVLHTWCGLGFTPTILLALSLAVAWIFVFFRVLPPPPPVEDDNDDGVGIRGGRGGTMAVAVAEKVAPGSRVRPQYNPLGGARHAGEHTMGQDGADGGKSLEDAGALAVHGSGGGGDAASAMASARRSNCSTGSSGDHACAHGPLLAAPQSPANGAEGYGSESGSGENEGHGALLAPSPLGGGGGGSGDFSGGGGSGDVVAVGLTPGERLWFVAGLWPITVPLLVVYVAEYALQSGVWSAIGFPVRSSHARDEFYGYANWCYQLGVFASR